MTNQLLKAVQTVYREVAQESYFFIRHYFQIPERVRSSVGWLFPELGAAVLMLSGETLVDMTSSLI
jgi:hypothetical protein